MNWNDVRNDFPLLAKNPILTYLDNSATAQRPECVLEAERTFYERYNSNPLRGLYDLSQSATSVYEEARQKVCDFIGAFCPEEIIFTRNATESLNLIAYCFTSFLKPGDEIVTTVMEHHSNIIPWQQAAKRSGAVLRYIECSSDGVISGESLRQVMSSRTRLVAMTQISNVLGVLNDIKSFARITHEYGAVFVADGAQSVPHIPVNVKELDVDFMAFSGHKMCGPMGIGVLYGRRELLEKMPPFLTGGEMIEYVTREDSTWAGLPHKFEAGTVNAAGAAGLAAAIDYYNGIGFENILKRENELGSMCFDLLRSVPHVKIAGGADSASHHGIFTFTIDGVHPHDVSEILNADRICVRAGHHCAQPLMQTLGISSATRASIMFYNTEEEIERLAESLKTVRRRMGYAE